MADERHLWSGRFDSAPDDEVFQFQSSFGFDRQLFDDDITGSLAWTEALASAGILSVEESRQICSALDAIREEAHSDSAFVDGPDEDIHAFVERQLIERLGDLGRRLHTGRSRNEQVSLDLRLYLRRQIVQLQVELEGLILVLCGRASLAGDTLVPAYTHLRRAQPVLVAHALLAHATAFQRDWGRFEVARDEADAMPLGSGAVAGTSYSIDTQSLAQTLGFSRVVKNSIDAASDRDFVSSMLHACALTMVHISRLAEDLIIFTSEEFGHFELSDSVATGSSLMPQKKNPDPLELVRGKSGRVIGHLTGWLTTMKGLPSGYNKDLQEDKEVVFDTERNVLGSIRATTRVVDSLAVCPGRTEAASTGMLLATDVADYLVNRGVPFRRAHEIVGGVVRDLVEKGKDFSSLSQEEWQGYDPSFAADVSGYITSRASVESRKTPQSTNPTEVARALAAMELWVQTQQRSRPGRLV